MVAEARASYTVAPTTCARCGGSVISEDGERWCLDCGRRGAEVEDPRVRASAIVAAAARAYLAGLVGEVQSAQRSREEAEQLHAALLAVGTPGLPALPWRRGCER